MKKLDVFCLVLLVTFDAALCRLPLFLNPKPYNYEVDAVYDPENPPGQKITDAKPLGYSKDMLPHPPNAGIPNPVYQLTNLNQRQVELRVETTQHAATICVRDDEEGPDICAQGVINQCFMASKDTLKFEFYCVESCQSSNVDFYFRFVVSQPEATDMWCSMRKTGGYPTDLMATPPIDKTGIPPQTPPPPKEGGSGSGGSGGASGSKARAVFPTLGLIVLGFVLALIN